MDTDKKPVESSRPTKIHKEEMVCGDNYHTVYRMAVPGGWIYSISGEDCGRAMCFVPNLPANIPAIESQEEETS